MVEGVITLMVIGAIVGFVSGVAAAIWTIIRDV